MQRHHTAYRIAPEAQLFRQFKSRNPLGIEKINFMKNHQKQLLIIIMESHRMFNQEIQATLTGNRLILEAPFISSDIRPIRTHLIQRDIQDEFEKGTLEIGASEIKLKPGFNYTLISCKALDPSLLKVILKYQPLIKSD
jgi:hypothetical protein